METRLQQNLSGNWDNYIFPFFWQYGGSQADIALELEKIYDCGIRAVCVESRPHPDYCGPRWWSDMDIIMEFAKKHGMKVWLLDDDRFPTGHANQAFSDGKNPLSVRFLTVHNTDVLGPKKPGYMLVKSLLAGEEESGAGVGQDGTEEPGAAGQAEKEGPGAEKWIGVIACRRISADSPDLDLESAVDVTEFVKDGWLCWDVPEGLWRILVFYTTRNGNGKLDYFNIVDSASVKVLLDRVYEPHFARYGAEFGKTFQGFFSDEPEFSNLPGYEFQARLGKDMPYLPWSGELKHLLEQNWGRDFLTNLPALWYECGPKTPHIRYEYMDAATRQLALSFSGQIRAWCEAHGVSHIGHIIEDDNSHGRLGCSTGHYFRSIGGMRMAGVDVVTQQIMPGMDQEEHQWVASSRDGEFFHYGLAKLGSSLAHVDVKKRGDAMCEIFGAFGWQEGIGLMKWLTDHMISRGINHFTPHAFSLKPYPDPDCPPHFYAHGNQPQYRHFDCLMNYMNRLSHLFSGGSYPARIAVLYHADAEWAGEAMLYQKPVRALQENQLDCDVIPADLLKEGNTYGAVFEEGIRVAGQWYRILVIPGCEYLPLAAAEFLAKEKEHMFCIFVDRRPEGICEQTEKEGAFLQELAEIEVVSLDRLAERVKELHRPFLKTEGSQPKLCTYPYISDDGSCYVFCFNEALGETYDCRMELSCGTGREEVLYYDAVHNRCHPMDSFWENGALKVEISLEPGEAAVLVIREKTEELLADSLWNKAFGTLNVSKDKPGKPSVRQRLAAGAMPAAEGIAQVPEVNGPWRISCQEVGKEAWNIIEETNPKDAFHDVTAWVIKEGFCGTLAYETVLEVSREQAGPYVMRVFGDIDCADIFVNETCNDRVIGSPMYGDVTLTPGKNVIRLELPLTPVFRDGDPWSTLTVLPRLGLTQRPRLIPGTAGMTR